MVDSLLLGGSESPSSRPQRSGGGGIPERQAEAADRRRIEQDLRASLAEGSFTLHYQPRVALTSGEVTGVEALIRWPHRRRGLVPPSAFIPIAERSELIDAIGGWVLRTACREAASWSGRGINVAVNVSARQLRNGTLCTQLAEALDASGLAPERLELELTESMLIDGSVDTLLTLSAIRDLGVGVALDDFGTGYASLAMIKSLPLTMMKLDRSLIRGLPIDPTDGVIVRGVIDTGHALGLTVVAEGVETVAQRDFLLAARCDEMQGFLFSPALPVPELLRLLRR